MILEDKSLISEVVLSQWGYLAPKEDMILSGL
jgi:hypothetical protein